MTIFVDTAMLLTNVF